MARQPLEDFLATKDQSIHALIVTLDKAILKGAPDVDTAIKWKQYMYSFDSKWMSPICCIDTTKKGIALRFLAGSEMADPLGVLRFEDEVHDGLIDWATLEKPLPITPRQMAAE